MRKASSGTSATAPQPTHDDDDNDDDNDNGIGFDVGAVPPLPLAPAASKRTLSKPLPHAARLWQRGGASLRIAASGPAPHPA